MSNPHLLFHHFGLAVTQPHQAKAFVSAQNYRMGETVFDLEQNVFSILCVHETEPAIEILWPGGTKGPIDDLTRRNPSGIIYHICYETGNLAGALASLEEDGNHVICIAAPKTAPLFGNREVSFYNLIGIGLIEILS
jgi:methylmalonyl-CoA/ethylmalonyl-CoA epimerase